MSYSILDILALDLATDTGFCRGQPGAKELDFGCIRFKKRDETMEVAFDAFSTWLANHLLEDAPSLVIFEAPALPFQMRGNTTYMTLRYTYGLAAICELVCKKFDVRCEEAKVSDIRHYCLGRNPRSKIAKELVIQRAAEWGHVTDDHNAADAIMLHAYKAALINPAIALSTAPLFHVSEAKPAKKRPKEKGYHLFPQLPFRSPRGVDE